MFASRVCRCCLTTNLEKAYSFKNYAPLLQMLTGSQLPEGAGMSWLCYRCAHTIRKLSTFRDLCIRADNVLMEYYMKNTHYGKEFNNFEQENYKPLVMNEQTYSNTLCLDVYTPTDLNNKSHTSVISYVYDATMSKNVSQGMTERYINRQNDRHNIEKPKIEAIDNFGYGLETGDLNMNVNSFEFIIVNDLMVDGNMGLQHGQKINYPQSIVNIETGMKIDKDTDKIYPGMSDQQRIYHERMEPPRNYNEAMDIARYGGMESKLIVPEIIESDRMYSAIAEPTINYSNGMEQNKCPDMMEPKILYHEPRMEPKVMYSEPDKMCIDKVEPQKDYVDLIQMQNSSVTEQFMYSNNNQIGKTYSNMTDQNHFGTGMEINAVCSEGIKPGTNVDVTKMEETQKESSTKEELTVAKSEPIRTQLAEKILPKQSSNSEDCLKDFEITYNCKYCRLPFGNVAALPHHHKFCKGDRTLKIYSPNTKEKTRGKRKTQEKDSKTPGENENTSDLSCKFCSQTFPHQSYLKNHLLYHETQKNFKSDVEKSTKGTSMDDINGKSVGPTEDANSVKIIFHCELCNMSFEAFSDFVKHESIHLNKTEQASEPMIVNDSFKCENCDELFDNETDLSQHILTHESDALECAVCNKVFKKISTLKKHELVHLDLNNFSCDTCGEKFKSKSTLETHMCSHSVSTMTEEENVVENSSQRTAHVCGTCGVLFEHLSELKMHETTHELDEIVEDANTTLSKNFDNNAVLHGTADSFECQICNVSFVNPFLLREHVRMHTMENCFKCFCGKTFRNLVSLKMHKQTHVDGEDLNCFKCALQFSSFEALIEHKKTTHVDEEEFTCLHCDEQFPNAETLLQHKKMYHRIKGSKCNICKRVYLTKTALMKHWHTHFKDTPHRCEFCGKCFKLSGCLKMHLRTHTNEMFSCNLCSYKGVSESQLKLHYTIHSGMKRFACQFCSYASITKKQLRRHILRHNENAL